ncbi:FecR family protein [Rhodohalobacter mucosus]|nr:FecR family protein [Rhodohalobacter mucosus]
MSNTDNIWALIARHHDHSLSETDARKLEEWLEASNENRRIFHSVDRIWKASEEKQGESIIGELNLEKDWNCVSGKINRNPEEKRARIRHFRKIRKRQQFFSNLLKVAALVLVAFTSGILTLKYAPQQSDENSYQAPVFNEIVTYDAERAGIELGDGSRVTLNAASKLTIPDRFSSDTREVTLQGQAFFDIKRDKNRPFHIKAGNAVVEVVGTSFDVRYYENENLIQVVVKTGTVELRNNNDKENRLIVNEGYKGTINTENGRLTLEMYQDPDSYFGWMDGRIVFRNADLEDVFKELERWYDVDITINNEVQGQLKDKFTANLKTRSVTEVMDVIRESMNINYEVLEDGDRILVKR